jgi:2-C-methyl-D-erythritol 4-phosphate cytidylyltransferase
VVNNNNSVSIKSKICQYGIKKVKDIILGGPRRQDSVYNALKVIDERTDFILVHDAARPFINKEMVSLAIKTAKKHKVAITGVPVKATIKEATKTPASPAGRQRHKDTRLNTVKKTLNRDNLWEIQTPQVFKKEIILLAYGRYRRIPISDDAGLVEKLGVKAKIVTGSYFNIKITTPEDLILAEAISNHLKEG